MQIPIDDELIKDAIKQSVKELGLVPETDLRGRQISIDDFRRKYCQRKSPEWVRQEIFDRYPETLIKNGGFVNDPHPGKGHQTWINEYDAAQWMQANYKRINWHAKLLRG